MKHVLGCLAAVVASLAVVGMADAKVPGQTYCYNSVCRRVHTLQETAASIGVVETVTASFYDDPLVDKANPNRMTSSGELFDANATNNAASPVWPDGTLLLVRAPASGRAALVRVNNAGPYHVQRLIDLPRRLAEELGIAKFGIASVQVTVARAPNNLETKFIRGRIYPRVVGYIGAHATMIEALAAAHRDLAKQSGAPPAPAIGHRWTTSTIPTRAKPGN